MPEHTLLRETVIDRPIEEVFDFFCRAENLEKITPPSLSFRILTPLPVEMREGTLIDYVIKLSGLPMKWRTLIAKWDPPHVFVDQQLNGPYLKWHHEHRFVAEGNRTRMFDRVEYRVPGWILEPIIHRLFVRQRVESIFDHRTKVIQEVFG